MPPGPNDIDNNDLDRNPSIQTADVAEPAECCDDDGWFGSWYNKENTGDVAMRQRKSIATAADAQSKSTSDLEVPSFTPTFEEAAKQESLRLEALERQQQEEARKAKHPWNNRRGRVVLVLASILIFLLGVMVGACGTGQCSRNKDTSPAVSAIETSCTNRAPTQTTLASTPSESPTTVPASSTAPTTAATLSPTEPPQDDVSPFGDNVIVFDPNMTTAEIQSTADSIFAQQQNDEMGSNRYSLLFLPGTYGSVSEPLMLQIGYYTEVAGLGENPTDVVVYGKIEVYNRCFTPAPYQTGQFIPTSDSQTGLCFALNSFWRGMSNLSIQIVSQNQDACRATAMFWAISQAASMRRVDISGGDVSLMDYCSNPAYASGGFLADTRTSGKIISGSQQQFLTRNSNVGTWDGAVWNQVFVGVEGAPDDDNYPDPPFVTIGAAPVSREKPYLFFDTSTNQYAVRVPSLATESFGISWSAGTTPGVTLPLSDFFVAKPTDLVTDMNAQLAAGKHLLLTPGVYNVAKSIVVDRADTVVLGMGLATLKAVNGAIPLVVSSQPGIFVAGITIDAGDVKSPVLLQVGDPNDTAAGDPTNPIVLSDVYFRLGGPYIGKADVCLQVNSNHVLIDHTWVWRADHGVEDFDESNGFAGDNERWVTNIGPNGVVINGDDVTIMGLFVEHFQEHNLVWNGERGRVFFFQNELPYEPPSQEEWTTDDGTLGWAAYKVSDTVSEHELWGGGVYCYNRNNPDVVTAKAFEVPNTSGVQLNRVYTRNLSGPGSILAVVNGSGQPVDNVNQGPYYLLAYQTE